MKTRNLVTALLITSLLIIILFRSVIFKLNTVYFSDNGDGLKSYYCASYHVLHDATPDHFKGMNYPWGESMYFTDGQAPLTNTVRFIDRHIFSCAHKMVGIINFMMIFSIFLGIIFLYLILKEFEIPDWYALLSAFGIGLLSPQIGRIVGHFSLAWLCWIPILIYLTVKMTKAPGWGKSIAFALITIVASLMHMYFFLFAVALSGIYWFDRIFIHKLWRKRWIELLHPFVQIVVPFIIIQFIMVDGITDRTNFPYGFFVYRAYPSSVFLPIQRWYVPSLLNYRPSNNFDWESIAYIGIPATIGFLVFVGHWLFRAAKSHGKSYTFTGNQALDILFWSAILLLIFSFGVPFIWGFERLLKYLGFINQLRGLARFSWLFYYIINLLIWIKLYQFITKSKNKLIAYSIFVLAMFVFLFEAVDNAKSKFDQLNNQVPALTDIDNNSDANSWVRKIDPQKYQAIMPLPYFHIGSESCWIEPQCDIMKQMFIVSLKTGLPCNGVMLGRTSISQSYKNIGLSLIPWNKYEVLDELPSDKPFLLIVDKCNKLNINEQHILDKSNLILTTPNFSFHELYINDLKKIPAEVNFPQRYLNFIDSITKSVDCGKSDVIIKRTGNFNLEEPNFKSASEGPYWIYERILDTTVQFDSLQTIYIRFWVKDYAKDMVVRTRLLIVQSGMEQNTLDEIYADLFRYIVSLRNDWALIEIPLELKANSEILKVLINNQIISCHHIVCDEFTVSNLKI